MGSPRKIFLSNLLLLIGINLLIKPFYLLVIEAQVQERTGPSEFGIYFALLNISYILNIIPDLGITNWNNRHIAQQGHVYRNELIQLIRLRSFLAAIYLIVCLVFVVTLNYDNHEIKLMLLIAFNQVLATAVLFMRSYLSGLHAFAADRIVSVFDRLLLIILLGGLLIITPAHEHFPIEHLVLGQTLAYGITLLISFMLVWQRKTIDQKKNNYTGKSILSASIPYATLIVLSMMSVRIDAVMLERISGSFEAGIYAMTFRLGDMLSMMSYLFAVMLLPIFSRMLSKNENINAVFLTAFKLLFTGCAWLSVVIAFHSEWILDQLYNSHIQEASAVLPWTFAAAGLFSLQYTTGTLLTAAGKMKILIVISAIALCLNITLNFLLIPDSAAKGAGQAAFITQLFSFCIQLICTQRLYHVFKTSSVIRTIAFSILTMGAAFLINQFKWHPLLSITVISIGVVIFGSLLQMIPLRDLIGISSHENAS